MFKTLMSALKHEETPVKTMANRQHPRRAGDRCVALVNGKMHPVENWSSGGMLFAADDKLFGIDQDCDVTLKFKLRDQIINVTHKGTVVRKAENKIALEFAPIPKDVQTSFQQVVDDFVAQKFAESQQP